jgi:hypothetical protein
VAPWRMSARVGLFSTSSTSLLVAFLLFPPSFSAYAQLNYDYKRLSPGEEGGGGRGVIHNKTHPQSQSVLLKRRGGG